MAKGLETGGRSKGRPNNRTLERQEAAAETVALIGEVVPDAFAGDAHAFLVAVYKDPRVEPLARKDAAKAALPYEKPRPVTVTLANANEPLKVRSELEIGRRLAFVLELIARGEVKAKMQFLIRHFRVRVLHAQPRSRISASRNTRHSCPRQCRGL